MPDIHIQHGSGEGTCPPLQCLRLGHDDTDSVLKDRGHRPHGPGQHPKTTETDPDVATHACGYVVQGSRGLTERTAPRRR
ncbi:MAG: hypothetical protein AB7R89_13140, partial [Dehalococcoidia bacterium]